MSGGVPHHESERGAILVIAAFTLTVALFAAALAIDIGGEAQVKRQDQKLADLAALDAARALPDPTAPSSAAADSAKRNNFDPAAAGNLLKVELGQNDTTKTPAFQPGLTPFTAVRVTVSSLYHQFFVFGTQRLTAKAVATQAGAVASFEIGSALATVNPAKGAPVLSDLMKNIGASGGITALSYKGLASDDIKLGDLATQLGLGTVDQLLTTKLSAKQIALAEANLLPNGSPEKLELLGLAPTLPSVPNIALGGSAGPPPTPALITVAPGGDASALSGHVNALGLLTGVVELSNGTSFVTVPDLSLNLAPIANTSLQVKVISPAQSSAEGPVGTKAHDTQLELKLTANLLTVAGFPAGTITIDLTAGNAIGTIANIDCPPAPESIKVGVTVNPGQMAMTATVLGLPFTATAVTGGSAGSLKFNYPADFQPPAGPTPAVGPQSTGLTDLGPGFGASINGTDPLGLISTILKPAVDLLDSQVISPAATALGVNLGAADVWALTEKCNGSTPKLVS